MQFNQDQKGIEHANGLETTTTKKKKKKDMESIKFNEHVSQLKCFIHRK